MDTLRFVSASVAVAASLCFVAASASPPQARDSENSERLTVNDPRPLSAAARLIEKRCRCVITYEDPRWGGEDVVDISGTIAHRPDVRPRIPKGRSFAFSVGADISSHTPAQMRTFLAQVVKEYEDGDSGLGRFHVTTSRIGTHIVPIAGSVLDVPITTNGGTGRILNVIATILDRAAGATGHKVKLGVFPANVLQKSVTTVGTHEPARTALERALIATGRKLSWQLLYDIGAAHYYLSIHSVP